MIRIANLHKSFNGQPVLRGVNLHVPAGKITVIVGRSGGGKSVLLKHIIGLVQPDAGQILVDGVDIGTLREKELFEVRKRFGYLFQDAALFDSMTVGENVAFPLREHRRLPEHRIREIVEEKLALVGLEGHGRKMPSELSGGMRKRAGLARAIALDPEILLFDEPTTGLDPIMTETIDNLVIQTQKRLGLTCVVISHDIGSTFRIAHKIALLYEGIIAAEGNPFEFSQVDHPIVNRFLRGLSWPQHDLEPAGEVS
ncbi:ABC transporter ATP-binding protein [Dissulfurirhabdus thermomarina]|uniref:ABC transporter ATP-binding protein n=1 Tax=Dissulfurirhabdus thermomarina TaxID=1765737 RepID=A0A6N9TMP3_DISTH|nr:ABC transporter ATP-binding protein [Dissulfurirhabdus thermomarina]NDY42552.1 ABC transporter ATP-binding protein [Dissulfurirhabdus thermomarina]NMX23689.1 ABC transporter ATP-binding protein [Dissulfurirhabdus thermomarina]